MAHHCACCCCSQGLQSSIHQRCWEEGHGHLLQQWICQPGTWAHCCACCCSQSLQSYQQCCWENGLLLDDGSASQCIHVHSFFHYYSVGFCLRSSSVSKFVSSWKCNTKQSSVARQDQYRTPPIVQEEHWSWQCLGRLEGLQRGRSASSPSRFWLAKALPAMYECIQAWCKIQEQVTLLEKISTTHRLVIDYLGRKKRRNYQLDSSSSS